MSQSTVVTLGEITNVAPNAAWPGEVAFSTWLAANLGRLTDVLGVGDLELVGTELPVGDFRCDVVAREVNSNRFVVIENQFSKTDHDHLGKLPTYATQHDAQMVMWISPEIHDEHRAAIDWLNKTTRDEIGFFAVQLRVIAINGSLPAPLLELRSSANVLLKPASISTVSAPSARDESYRKFFQPLIDELRDKYHFTKARIAQPLSWYFFASGTKGFNYKAEFASGKRMRATIYIDMGVAEANKAAFDALFNKRVEFQAKMTSDLVWERLDNRRACRISVVKQESSIDQVSSNASDARTWLIEKLLELKAVFGAALPAAASASETGLDPLEPAMNATDGVE